jgi:hypothetical protein
MRNVTVDDPRLSRQLRAIEEPVVADPAFLDALFARLLDEAGLRRAAGQRESSVDMRRSKPAGATATHRRRSWVPPLLVAVLAIGGGLAVAAGVGGFINRGESVPNVCVLVAPAEIGAIVGAPVRLVSSDEYGSGAPANAGRSCAYSYPPRAPGGPARNLGISIARPADPAADWAQLQTGVGAFAIEGLGDAATLFPTSIGSVVRTLYVLKGPYVLSVFYLVGGNNVLPQHQMEDIARLMLARL